MALFKHKSKQSTNQNKSTATTETPILALEYIQTPYLRGSDCIKLASYDYKKAEDGIAAVSSLDYHKLKVTATIYAGKHPRVEIFLDQHQIGTIWQRSWPDHYDDFKSRRIEKVSAKISDGQSWLFVYPKHKA